MEEYAERKELEYYQANSLGNGASSADDKHFPLVYAQKNVVYKHILITHVVYTCFVICNNVISTITFQLI